MRVACEYCPGIVLDTDRELKCISVSIGRPLLFDSTRWRHNNDSTDSHPYTHETHGIIIFATSFFFFFFFFFYVPTRIRYDSISSWLNRLTSNFVDQALRRSSFHSFSVYIPIYFHHNRRNGVPSKSVYGHLVTNTHIAHTHTQRILVSEWMSVCLSSNGFCLIRILHVSHSHSHIIWYRITHYMYWFNRPQLNATNYDKAATN